MRRWSMEERGTHGPGGGVMVMGSPGRGIRLSGQNAMRRDGVCRGGATVARGEGEHALGGAKHHWPRVVVGGRG